MKESDAEHVRLDPSEYARYGRHLVLPEVGMEGQLRLRSASVALVGAGGLGSPLALYLAAAGVGRIGLVEFDTVELSNLQRQILYETNDVGRSKLAAARKRIADVNPNVEVSMHEVRLAADNALDILRDYDAVADGTDNFPTRYLVNDACVLLRKPNVYGSIFRFEGQVSVFEAGRGPCYRCLFPEPPLPGSVPNCAEGGVLGILPGIIGTLQATEVIKLLLDIGESLHGRLLLFNALEMRFHELKLRRDPECPVCGENPSIRELADEEAACILDPLEELSAGDGNIGVTELHERLQQSDGPVLLDVRSPQEWAICRLEGARLIPIEELVGRMNEIDPEREIAVYCHLGIRSAMAVRMLRRNGCRRARNVVGGIDAWAKEVDPSTPRY